MTLKKKFFFYLLTFLILWLLIDIATYFFLKRYEHLTAFFYKEPKPPTVEYLEEFYQTVFHPRWGWDIPITKQGQLGNRKSRIYDTKKQYKIKVFGDSFAYGNRVQDNETFEYFIEERTNWACLNYAVHGYGTDQALLKYKDNTINTKYTILCILDENIARLLNVWRGFIWPDNPFPKPRFLISGKSSFSLVNFVTNYSELKKHNDINFLYKLRKFDYWPEYYERQNTPHKLKWPSTLTVIPHMGFFLRKFIVLAKRKLAPTYDAALTIRPYYHLYRQGSEGIIIMQYIVNEFHETARLRNEIPIIVVFPMTTSVNILAKFGRKPYGLLINHLENIQCNFIDFSDVFLHESYIDYYQQHNGHFSVKGNKRIADELIKYIREIEKKNY